MPVNESTNKWEISTVSALGSDWVTTTTPVSTWSTATTTTDSSYIWTTSTTPITAGSGTLTITYPSVPPSVPHECEFPFFDTYNLDSSRGREKFVEAFKEYLLTSFHPYITLRIDG